MRDGPGLCTWTRPRGLCVPSPPRRLPRPQRRHGPRCPQRDSREASPADLSIQPKLQGRQRRKPPGQVALPTLLRTASSLGPLVPRLSNTHGSSSCCFFTVKVDRPPGRRAVSLPRPTPAGCPRLPPSLSRGDQNAPDAVRRPRGTQAPEVTTALE